MTPASCFLGVDLGGSQLRMAAVTPAGRLLTDLLSVPTGKSFGPAELQRMLRELSERLRPSLNGRDVVALGLGTPGVVNDGPLSQCENLPLLNGVDIGDLVRDAVGCPAALENDARCFTLAEARYGAARGVRDVCGLTLGTGLGCGVMIGGRLYRGANSQAGEVWRVPLRGRPLEYFVSGAGVVRAYQAGGGAGAALDAAEVERRARAGDPAALAAWKQFGSDLADLCATVSALIDPALIVLGGSLVRAAGLYRPVLSERLAGQHTRIVEAALGPAAGVIGAAALNMASSVASMSP
jgi:glucokinase